MVAHKAVTCAFEAVHCVALAELGHRGLGRGNGFVDPRVVAGVEAKDGRLEVGELRLDSTVSRAGCLAVEHHRRIQSRLRGRVTEAPRAAPAEADNADLAVRRRQLLPVL